MLLDQKILVPAKPGCRDDLAPRIAPPLRSVHEMPACESGSALLAVPEVMATTWRCRRHIRRGPLKGVIRETVTYRSRLCRTATAAGGLHERRIVQAATLFHRARLYAPIGTRCLMDSIALCRFLARRHLHAEIILGVTNDPFAAHCWVQAGDMVLNDTVGNAMAHTVIRVI